MICKNCLQTFNVRLTDPFTPRLTLSRVIWPDSEGGEGEEKGWMCVWGMGNGGKSPSANTVHRMSQVLSVFLETFEGLMLLCFFLPSLVKALN